MTFTSRLRSSVSWGLGVLRTGGRDRAPKPDLAQPPTGGSYSREAQLAMAAAAGDVRRVEQLLDQGLDPNAQDATGWTALHHATAGRNAHTAAVLLARGAQHFIPNKKGHGALSLKHTSVETLHAVRQHYHRLPLPDQMNTEGSSERARAWADELERNGILKVSGLITPPALERMQDDFDRFVRSLDTKLAAGQGIFQRWEEEEHWWPAERFYETNNPFKYSSQLAELCCHDDLVSAMRLYLGKPAFIHRAQGLRYPPSPEQSTNQFHWHHDVEEKRFKIMVLLTDVGEHDQSMGYVVGSHRLFHPYPMFFENSCSLAYCRQHLPQLEIFRATGKAGDIIIFDSNGAHCGSRSLRARVRDVFIVAYTADKTYTWGADIDPAIFSRLSFRGPNPFERMLAAPKMWDLPLAERASAWPISLPRIESWL